MTRNELLELANTFYTGGFTEREIAFARVIAAAEREACAVIVENMNSLLSPEIVAAIRARGEHMTEQRYFAGGQEFLYPHAGDPPAPLDTKVLLLSKGGICTTGYWNATWCLGWLPLPKRNTEKEDIK